MIERRLSQVAGEPVRIRGNIDLRLLPAPYFTFDGVEAGDPGEAVSVSAASMQAELALTPLLRGEVDFVEARLQAPKLAITLAPDGSLHRSSGAPALVRDLRFERLVVSGGRIDIADPQTGRSVALTGVDFDAQADSVRGPFKGEGALSVAGVRTAVRASTGAYEAGKLRLKLIIGQSAGLPRVDLDGTLAIARGLPAFAGSVVLSGPVTLGGTPTRWRAAGTWQADPRRASSAAVEIRIGDDERAVSAQGPAQVTLGGQVRIAAQMRTRQADLDRALIAEGEPAPLSRVATALAQMLGRTAPMAGWPSLDLSWAADTLLLGGEPFADLDIGLDADADRPPLVHVDASVPGGGRLKLDGTLETGPAAAFNGQMDAALADVDRVAAWAAPLLPAAPPAFPVRSATAVGNISLSAIGFSGRDLRVGVDRSSLRGALAFTRAVGAERARLFADVEASPLDVRSVPDAAWVEERLRDVDLELRLGATGVRFERPGEPALEAGRVRLDLAKAGDDVHLRDLTVEGLGGASLSARGDADAAHAALEGRLEATRLDAVGTLAARLAPGPLADALVARARALSPVRLAWAAKASRPATGSPRLTELTVDGSAAATRVSGHMAPDGEATRGTLTIEAPDSVGLLRQAGVPVLAIAGSGPARLRLDARGRIGGPFATTIAATLGGTQVDLTGSIDPQARAVRGAARLSAADLAPLLQASAVILPDMTDRLPAALAGTLDWTPSGAALTGVTGTLSGAAVRGRLAVASGDAKPRVTGAIDIDRLAFATLAALALGPSKPGGPGAIWSSAPFGASLADPPATSVTLTTPAFDLPVGGTASDASLRVEVAPGLVRLRDVKAALRGGRLAGALDLRRDGAQAAIEGRIDARDVALSVPGATGAASFEVSVAGTGSTADALAASLGGAGRLTLADLTIARADPQAVGRVAVAIEDEKQGFDPAEVTRSLRRALEGASLPLGTRRFDVGLAGGTLRLTPETGGVGGPPLLASINLRTAALEARLDLAAVDLPATWHGAVPAIALLFKGPLLGTTPIVPAIESGDFLNVMAERAIARDSARIDAFEFDAHERAVANARLAFERRRDLERKSSEDKARAETARRPAEDIAPETARHPSAFDATARPSPDPAGAGRY